MGPGGRGREARKPVSTSPVLPWLVQPRLPRGHSGNSLVPKESCFKKKKISQIHPTSLLYKLENGWSGRELRDYEPQPGSSR